MPLDRIEITAEDIKATEVYQNSDSDVLKVKCITPMYVKDFSGYLTVCKYKGLDFMLKVYHMTDFKKDLLKELWKNHNK